MTFSQIGATALGKGLTASFERSRRRALQRLVEDGELVTAGDGGPADPWRYSITTG